jgi:hypothetical protein
MFGWRARIGYISPTVIEVLPYEFYKFAPDGVGLVGATCGIDDWKPEEFEKGLAQVKGAAAYLGSRKVDYIIHGGGPLVVARGKGYEEIICREVETASGVRATTGVRSAIEAMRHMGSKRIAIASCYPHCHFWQHYLPILPLLTTLAEFPRPLTSPTMTPKEKKPLFSIDCNAHAVVISAGTVSAQALLHLRPR